MGDKDKKGLKEPLLNREQNSLNSDQAIPIPLLTDTPHSQSPSNRRDGKTNQRHCEDTITLDALIFQEQRKNELYLAKREAIVNKLWYTLIGLHIFTILTSFITWLTIYHDNLPFPRSFKDLLFFFTKYHYGTSLIDMVCIYSIRTVLSILNIIFTKSDENRFKLLDFFVYWVNMYSTILSVCKLMITDWPNVDVFNYVFLIANTAMSLALLILHYRFSPIDVDSYLDDELEQKELLKRTELHQQQIESANLHATTLSGISLQEHLVREEARCARHERIEAELKRARVAKKKLLDQSNPLDLLKIIKPYFWPAKFIHKFACFAVWAVLIGSKICSLGSPLFIGRAVDVLQNQHRVPYIELSAFCLLTLGSLVLKQIQNVIYIKVKQQAFLEISGNLLLHCLNLDVSWHHSHNIGKTTRSLDRGISSVESMVQYLFLMLLPSLFETVTVFIIFFQHFNLPLVTATVTLCLSTYLIATILLTNMRRPMRKKARSYDNQYHEILQDALSHVETVKQHAKEEPIVDKYTSAIHYYQKSSVMTQATLALLNSIQSTIIQLCLLFSAILVSREIAQGHLSIGSLSSIIAFVSQIFSPLAWFGSIFDIVQQSLVDAASLLEIKLEKPIVHDMPNATNLQLNPNQGPTVEFRNVTFTYPNSNRGLKNVSFIVHPGERLAIVGSTGASKSTIVRLLSRFYDPQEGQILIDGQDIKTITNKSLKDAIISVPQDLAVFNDTILNNLLFAHPDATHEQIITACHYSGILDLILSLPLSFYTSAQKLSQGEKQRVILALALLKRFKGSSLSNMDANSDSTSVTTIPNIHENDGEISIDIEKFNKQKLRSDVQNVFVYGNDPNVGRLVVTDEMTSSVDVLVEKYIQRALNLLTASNTTLISISHRLAHIQSYDRILVMGDGSVLEIGSHEELLQIPDGMYRKMFLSQFIHDDEEPNAFSGDNSVASGSFTEINSLEREKSLETTLLKLHRLGGGGKRPKNTDDDDTNNNSSSFNNPTTNPFDGIDADSTSISEGQQPSPLEISPTPQTPLAIPSAAEAEDTFAKAQKVLSMGAIYEKIQQQQQQQLNQGRIRRR